MVGSISNNTHRVCGGRKHLKQHTPSFRLITGIETETTTEEDFLIKCIAQSSLHLMLALAKANRTAHWNHIKAFYADENHIPLRLMSTYRLWKIQNFLENKNAEICRKIFNDYTFKWFSGVKIIHSYHAKSAISSLRLYIHDNKMADPSLVIKAENVPVTLALTWMNEIFFESFLWKSLNPVCHSFRYTFAVLTVIKHAKRYRPNSSWTKYCEQLH